MNQASLVNHGYRAVMMMLPAKPYRNSFRGRSYTFECAECVRNNDIFPTSDKRPGGEERVGSVQLRTESYP